MLRYYLKKLYCGLKLAHVQWKLFCFHRRMLRLHKEVALVTAARVPLRSGAYGRPPLQPAVPQATASAVTVPLFAAPIQVTSGTGTLPTLATVLPMPTQELPSVAAGEVSAQAAAVG